MALSRDEMIAQILAKQKAQQQLDPKPTRDEMIAKILAKQKTAPEPTAGESAASALQGFGNQATFGYLPKIQAAVSSTLPKIQAAVSSILPNHSADVDEKLKAEGFQIPDGPTYAGEKAAFKQYGEGLAEKAPIANAIGSVGGAIITAGLPGGILGKAGKVGKAVFGAPAATLLGRVGQAAASGAVTGAIQDTEGDRLENARSAATFGGAVEGGLGLLGKAGRGIAALAPGLKKFAEERAVAAVGASKSDVNRLLKKDPTGHTGDELRKLGRFALDEKLVKAGDKIDDIAARIGDAKKAAGEELGSIYDVATLRGGTPFDTKKIADEAVAHAKDAFTGKPGGDAAIKAIEKQAENLAANGQADLNTLQQFKEGIDDLIPYDKGLQVMAKPEKDALLSMRRFLSEKITEHLDTLSPEYKGVLKKINSRYSKLSELDRITRNRVSSETGNNLLSLTDKMALLGGASVGAGSAMGEGGDAETMLKRAALGAGAGLLSKTARSYGRPLIMKGADVTGRGILGAQEAVASAVKSMTPKAAEDFVKTISKMGLTDPAQIGAYAARYQGSTNGK